MLRVSESAYPYLVAQVGELDHLKGNPAAWTRAYERSTLDRLNCILPHVPEDVGSMLDVGSGLGGIDVLLHRWFDCKARVVLMDGDNGISVSSRHDVPFCSAEVALEFQRDNHVRDATFMRCDAPIVQPFDLIISFRAWCFHMAPRVYLDYVLACCHAETRVIVDVRRRDGWECELLSSLRGQVIEQGEKYRRWVLRKK